MNPNDPLGLGGFNSQALHPDEASMNAGNLPARPQHAMPQGPGGLEGWLVRNAPTIGGTIGAVAAAPLNLLDAVSGVGGTALDVGAAGIGADIGQRIKNRFDPTQATNPEKEGLIGGVSELGGLGLGKMGGKAIGALGNGLKNVGQHYLASQANGLNDYLSGVAPQVFQNMKRYGYTALNQFRNVADKVTGNGGVLSNGVRDILDNAPTVNVSGLNPEAQDIIYNTPGLNEADQKSMSRLFNQIQENLGKSQGRNNLSQVAARDVFENGQKKFEKVAATDVKGNSEHAQTLRNAYRNLAGLYDRQIGSATGNVPISNEAKQQMITDLRQSGVNSPELEKDIMGVQTHQQLRSLQKTFVDAGNIADQTAQNKSKGLMSMLQNPLGRAGAGAGLLDVGAAIAAHNPAIALPAAAAMALNTPGAKAVGGPLLEKAGQGVEKLASNTGKQVVGKLTTRDVINKALTQSTGQGISQLYGNKSQITGGPISSMVNNQVSQVLNSASQQTQQPPIQMLTPTQISQILQTSGIEGLKSVEGAIDTNLAVQKQEYPELSTDQQGQIADITKALQGITDSAKLYEQAQALGAGSGMLAQLGTHIPGIQNTKSESALRAYEDNRGELAAQVATILGSGRSSASMIRQIESELPSATDSPGAAQTKFSLLVTRLNNAMQSTLATPATNTPGQLTNFSGQTVPGLNVAEPPDMNLLNFVGA